MVKYVTGTIGTPWDICSYCTAEIVIKESSWRHLTPGANMQFMRSLLSNKMRLSFLTACALFSLKEMHFYEQPYIIACARMTLYYWSATFCLQTELLIAFNEINCCNQTDLQWQLVPIHCACFNNGGICSQQAAEYGAQQGEHNAMKFH